MLARFDEMEGRLRDLTQQESQKRHAMDSELRLEQEKVKDLEERLEEEVSKHLTFKSQLQDKVNALRMEVSQRQKEYQESQKLALAKNKTLVRDNTRLKDEVRMLRQEIGLKPVPDPMNDSLDDEFGAP